MHWSSIYRLFNAFSHDIPSLSRDPNSQGYLASYKLQVYFVLSLIIFCLTILRSKFMWLYSVDLVGNNVIPAGCNFRVVDLSKGTGRKQDRQVHLEWSWSNILNCFFVKENVIVLDVTIIDGLYFNVTSSSCQGVILLKKPG